MIDSCSKKKNMIIHKEESYKIVGAAFKVYNNLGAGFLEAVYQEAGKIKFYIGDVRNKSTLSSAMMMW